MTFVSYAQNFEDVMLWRALKHIERGFYIDVGAQHPVVDSVSLAFYEHGWRGVHIEPVPFYANLLQEYRPDETVIQAAIGARKGVMAFFEFPETGLSTGDREIASRHKKEGFGVNEINVPCLTLSEALSLFSGREIHWLKIDVEGYERQVLEGWGSAIKPWVVVIESTLPLRQTESYREWEYLILDLGYKFVYFDGLNRFFVSSEHVNLQDAFHCGPNVFDDFTLSGTATNSFCTNLKVRFEKELTQFSGQLESLESKLLQSRAESDLLHKNVVTTQQYATRIESELAKLKNVTAGIQRHLHAREAELAAIYESWSWRMTKPLRQIKVLAKVSTAKISAVSFILTKIPRHAAKRVLLSVWEYVKASPERKIKVTRLLARFPRIDRYLRGSMHTNKDGKEMIMQPSALDAPSASLTDPSNVKVRWEHYSPSVSNAYQKLMQARAQDSVLISNESKTENSG